MWLALSVWGTCARRDHAREQAALTANKGGKILDWLATHAQQMSAR